MNNPYMKSRELTSDEVKKEIRKMKVYDINKLGQLAEAGGLHLMTVNFWWNAMKN